MAVYKEEKTNTWRAVYRYTDWNGERKQTQKRGFKTKREAQAWEREQLNKSTADLDMTFKSFVDLYTADMKTRLKENTWATKDHIIRTKLLPYFGKLKMCKITAQQIITWQNEMMNHKDEQGKPYSSDPEDLLPLPDRMESAKSYREKKSKPLLEKIVKVVRSVYRAYLDVCQKFELLQRKYDTEVPYLKEQLAEVRGENAELQETARDYHRLCRAYGPERVAETVAAVKQQEQAEKEQKRSQKRRHDRDAR